MIKRLLTCSLSFIALMAAALSTGAAVYYLLALMILMMAAVGLASALLALFTVSASLGMPMRKLQRGDVAHLSLTARYMSILPVRSLQVRLLIPEDQRATDTLDISLPPFVWRKFTFKLPCPHRGVYHVGLDAIVVGDVFGLFTFHRKIRGARQKIEVRPAVTDLPPMQLLSTESDAGIISRSTEDTASPSDTRNYQMGDPLKRIHWKLSARKRELLVRTYEESAKPDTLIMLDLSPLNILRSQALSLEDVIIESAASIAVAQLRASNPVRMPLMAAMPQELSGQSTADTARILDALTRIPFDSPYPFDQVLMLEMRRMQRTGAAVLITSRLTPRTCDIAQQMKRNGMQVAVLFVTDTRRPDALEMIERLNTLGIQTQKIDPYGQGISSLEDFGV